MFGKMNFHYVKKEKKKYFLSLNNFEKIKTFKNFLEKFEKNIYLNDPNEDGDINEVQETNEDCDVKKVMNDYNFVLERKKIRNLIHVETEKSTLTTINETNEEIIIVEPVKVEPPKIEPVRVEPVKIEPPKIEPVKVEPVKVEPVKVEPVKVEPVKVEPVKVEPVKVEPPKIEPPKIEPVKVEPVKVEPVKVEPPKIEPVKVEPPKIEPPKIEPPRIEIQNVESIKRREVNKQPPKVEPQKVESPKVEPVKVEPPKIGPPKIEPPKIEIQNIESIKRREINKQPPKVEPPKVEPPKVEPPKIEPPKVEPQKVESPKVEPIIVEFTEKEIPKIELPREQHNFKGIVGAVKDKIDKLCFVYKSIYKNANAPGFGDFIRGSYFILQFCEKYKFPLEILIQHPMQKFLKNQNKKIDSNKLSKVEFYQKIFKNNKPNKDIQLDFLKHLNQVPVWNENDTKTTYVYTNAFTIDKYISNSHKQKMREILEPCDSVNEKMNVILSKFNLVKKNYIVVHIRSGDSHLIGNEEINAAKFGKIYSEIKKLSLFDVFEGKVLLLSDSVELKRHLVKYLPFKCIFNDITHLGEGIPLESKDEKLINTLVDFFLFANAMHVFSFSFYQHGSGFSEWACRTYDVPYRSKFITV